MTNAADLPVLPDAANLPAEVRIDGRVYRVEAREPDRRGRPRVALRGARGAHYVSESNIHDPSLVAWVNECRFGLAFQQRVGRFTAGGGFVWAC